MHCNADAFFLSKDGGDGGNPGYLVLSKSDFCRDSSVGWNGDTIHVKPTAETTISLSQIEVGACHYAIKKKSIILELLT